jgi:WD40 repeat protein
MYLENVGLCLSVLGLSSIFVVDALPQSVSFGEWKLVRTMTLNGPTNHIQGIEFDADSLWVTSVDSTNRKGYLREFSLTSGNLTKGIEVQQGERFHPGGIAADAESLWFPVAEYRPNSASIIQRRNKRTLGLEVSFNVPDHIGCIAVTPEYLVGGNWDSREFYVWDHTGKLVRKAAPNTGNAYQDMKFEGGLLVASGLLADHTGAVDWMDSPSFHLVKRVKFGSTERHTPFTREGMAVRGKELLVLPEDEPSRLFVFNLDR